MWHLVHAQSYAQRFRRRWLVAKDKVVRGELGEISTIDDSHRDFVLAAAKPQAMG
jgi:hypothetical protein